MVLRFVVVAVGTLRGTPSSANPAPRPDTERARVPRADRRRNRERIVAAAAGLVARDGARASLEEIARQAGVGSATLHRHFPSRRALLEAVFHDHVERLCARARALATEHDAATALPLWLGELAAFAAGTRGLAAALLDQPGGVPEGASECQAMLHGAATELVDDARAAGAIRPAVTADDVLALVNAISLATEGDPATARRLLDLALTGVGRADAAP